MLLTLFIFCPFCSPAVSPDVQNENYNDNCPSLVPIIPVEEEESPYIPEPVNTTTSSQPLDLSGSSLPSEMLNKCNSSSREPLSSALPALGVLPSLGADVVAAASAALAVSNKVGQNGSMIDAQLLIKILRDPKMIQKLIPHGPPLANTGSASTNMVSPPITGTNKVTQSVPMSFPLIPDMRSANGKLPDRVQSALNTVPLQPDTVPVSGFNRATPSSFPAPTPESCRQVMPSLSNGNLFTVPNRERSSAETVSVHPNTAPTAMLLINEARQTKDVNYYKNLIRKHGGEKEESEESIFSRKRNHYKNLIRKHGWEKEEMEVSIFPRKRNHYNDFEEMKLDQNIKRGELKLKNSEPCKYFKSTKGCRNGINCPYQHAVPIQWRTGSLGEAQSAKRMRLGGEIAGGDVIQCMNHLL